ncbi:MAG: histidine phosphotransferase family protein [Rhodospirillales bacterium]
MADPLGLAQLLTSRMCHDLSGAIGVTASAEDLIGVGADVEEDAVSLVADAGRRAAARLAFFRAAFGFERASRNMPLAELRALVEPALGRPRLGFAWDVAADGPTADSSELPAATGRLALCLVLLASEALPRGGTVRLSEDRSLSHHRLSIEAEGVGARLTPQALAALRATDCQDLTSANVVGYYAQVLARCVAAEIAFDVAEGKVRLSLTPIGAEGSQRH